MKHALSVALGLTLCSTPALAYSPPVDLPASVAMAACQMVLRFNDMGLSAATALEAEGKNPFDIEMMMNSIKPTCPGAY